MAKHVTTIRKALPISPWAGRAAVYVRMSTEHQQYSIPNQLEVIDAYADRHQLKIARTYIDPARSGLRLAGRPGLRSLLADVESGQADYSRVLVYDVSRWGRFQNTDESAFYDFTCRLSGIRVIYCAEPFEGYGDMMEALAKSLKRWMAAEYSRELSVKTWSGCRNLAARGFKLGGATGIGLRRMLVDEAGYPKTVLQHGERKALLTDRVILVPGPREEVEVVWKIFDLYAHTGMYMRQIAGELNKGKVSPPNALKWNSKWVRGVLKAEVYTGDYVWNKFSAKLGGRQTPNPPDRWVRCNRAFRPLVTRDLFELAQAKLQNESHPLYTCLDLKRKLERALRKYGHLSVGLLVKEYAIAPTTYALYFGSLRKAYEAVGYCPLKKQDWKRNRDATNAIRRRLVMEISDHLARAGIAAVTDPGQGLVTVDDHPTLYVHVARSHLSQRRGYCWHVAFPDLRSDYVLLTRLDQRNQAVEGFFLLPHAALSEVPGHLSAKAKPIRHFRIEGLDYLVPRLFL